MSLTIPVPWVTTTRTSNEVVVMASRLQLRSPKHSAMFVVHSLRLLWQSLRAPGNVGAALRAEPLRGRFWTLSAWESEGAIKTYAMADPHRTSMRQLRSVMEDSRFVTYSGTGKPRWSEAVERIKSADAEAAQSGASAENATH